MRRMHSSRLTSHRRAQRISIFQTSRRTRVDIVLLGGRRIVDADLWGTHLVRGSQIAGTRGLVDVLRERLLTNVGEHFGVFLRLAETCAYCGSHTIVVLRSESRQLVLMLRHEPWGNVWACAWAVIALGRMVVIVQAELAKTETVAEARIRRGIQHGRGLRIDVEAVQCV